MIIRRGTCLSRRQPIEPPKRRYVAILDGLYPPELPVAPKRPNYARRNFRWPQKDQIMPAGTFRRPQKDQIVHAGTFRRLQKDQIVHAGTFRRPQKDQIVRAGTFRRLQKDQIVRAGTFRRREIGKFYTNSPFPYNIFFTDIHLFYIIKE